MYLKGLNINMIGSKFLYQTLIIQILLPRLDKPFSCTFVGCNLNNVKYLSIYPAWNMDVNVLEK